MARAAATSDAFNAVAEPRRREILNFLALDAERPVGEIVAALSFQAPSSAAGGGAGELTKGRPKGPVSSKSAGDPASMGMDGNVREVLASSAGEGEGKGGRRRLKPKESMNGCVGHETVLATRTRQRRAADLALRE